MKIQKLLFVMMFVSASLFSQDTKDNYPPSPIYDFQQVVCLNFEEEVGQKFTVKIQYQYRGKNTYKIKRVRAKGEKKIKPMVYREVSEFNLFICPSNE